MSKRKMVDLGKTLTPTAERPLPPAPGVGVSVRIPLTQLSAYLATHRLRVARGLEMADGTVGVGLVNNDECRMQNDERTAGV